MQKAMANNKSKKILKISSKRQITLPKTFFFELGFADTAECFVRGNEIVIRPLNLERDGEFSEQILKDIIEDGYSGKELLEEFKRRRAKIRPAVEKLISQANDAANGKGEYCGYADIFGTEEEE